MAELPRDPRQLAKDILSGKISIEDLAREQQRRRGVNVPPKQPEKYVPLPRVSQDATPPQPRSTMRQAPPPLGIPQTPPRPAQRPQPRPVAARPAQPPRQQVPRTRNPQPVRQAVRRTAEQTNQSTRMEVGRPLSSSKLSAQPAAGPGMTVAQPLSVEPSTIDPQTQRPMLLTLLRERNYLRQGILMAEILGPPRSLNDPWA
jgi:hypothetical protein